MNTKLIKFVIIPILKYKIIRDFKIVSYELGKYNWRKIVYKIQWQVRVISNLNVLDVTGS